MLIPHKHVFISIFFLNAKIIANEGHNKSFMQHKIAKQPW